MSSIKEMLPLEELPREKFIKYGVKSLTDADLIAIILRCGTKDKTVKDLADEIKKNLKFKNLTLANLTSIKGIGLTKAITLLSAIELGQRTLNNSINNKECIKNAQDVYNIFKNRVANLTTENLIVIFLDTKNQIISTETIFKGTINAVITHPREIYHAAINNLAASIILLHNHPSGVPSPSKADCQFTNSVAKTGNIIGIPLLDHIIIGNNNYYSFKEKGLL